MRTVGAVLVRRSLRREGHRTLACEPESVNETLVEKKLQVGMVEGVSHRDQRAPVRAIGIDDEALRRSLRVEGIDRLRRGKMRVQEGTNQVELALIERRCGRAHLATRS